jgi:hypothetical protein
MIVHLLCTMSILSISQQDFLFGLIIFIVNSCSLFFFFKIFNQMMQYIAGAVAVTVP